VSWRGISPDVRALEHRAAHLEREVAKLEQQHQKMLEVLKADYMQVARSKGLKEPFLILVHAFPNALIPVVTVMGIAFALLMTASVVVENVFVIKGLGRLLIQGILNRDYAVVQGAILVVSAIFVFVNLLVDMLYTVIDPRIRY